MEKYRWIRFDIITKKKKKYARLIENIVRVEIAFSEYLLWFLNLKFCLKNIYEKRKKRRMFLISDKTKINLCFLLTKTIHYRFVHYFLVLSCRKSRKLVNLLCENSVNS